MSRPLVLVTLGTHEQPFERPLAWLEPWRRRRDVDVVVQHGVTRPMRGAENHEMLPPARLLELMATASAVVTHGGTGSLMDARSCGRVPIVVARSAAFGEHVDDHQLTCTARLADLGLLLRADSAIGLQALVDRAVEGRLATRTGERGGSWDLDGVAAAVHGQGRGRARGSRARRLRSVLEVARR